MSNLVKNLLRAGVFSLAVVFAFAFTEPTDSNLQRFVPIYNGAGQIVDGTPVQSGYTCNDVTSDICTAEFLNNDPKQENLITSSIENGEYLPPM
ncbi:DUF6520 family protein [Arthrospiribacter ruber]|uniref:Uncharacterized protein n=1 Tax=Arthrospiribacter ruber TaxID=2487934 RepID=A0A951IVZ9_9BACT|nr:DUF6520 family protein [Arthrospiribacter ruber]MBW3466608.1 hypothetical protein [Arthrospiribacter ruber]